MTRCFTAVFLNQPNQYSWFFGIIKATSYCKYEQTQFMQNNKHVLFKHFVRPAGLDFSSDCCPDELLDRYCQPWQIPPAPEGWLAHSG